MSEKNDGVKIDDLEGDAQELTPEQAEGTKGGLPAVQWVREAATRTQTATQDPSTNTESLSLNFTKVQ